MAASASRTNILRLATPTGRRMEYGTITYDSDATVEVPTALSYIEHWTFGLAASGGAADLPSLDETVSSGLVAVPSTGAVTVDTASSNTNTYSYCFIGY